MTFHANINSVLEIKHSPGFCLSYLNDRVLKDFDNGLSAGMILIDLQKAFDTIDHSISLRKLRTIGGHSNKY